MTTKPIRPQMGGFDGLGDSAHPWEELHANSVKVENNTTKEICIGKRSNGVAGTGSWDNPFDGTTKAQVDAQLVAANSVSGQKPVIRFRDGEFLHSGHYVWTLLPQAQLMGEGIGVTILKLDPSVGPGIAGSLHAIHSPFTSDGNGIRVSDLTVDLNYTNLTTPPSSAAVNGVLLCGNNNVVENVRVINGYGSYADLSEHYGILLQGKNGDTSSYNCKILNCSTELFKGNYGNGQAIVGPNVSPYRCIGGLISGAYVSDYRPLNGVLTSGHCSAFGLNGGTLQNSVAYGCQNGVYIEQGIDVNFINLLLYYIDEIGIDLNESGADIVRAAIRNCRIELRDDSATQRWGIRFAVNGSNRVRSAEISGNFVYLKVTGNTPGNAATSYGIVSSISPESGLGYIIRDNHFDSTLHHSPFAMDVVKLNNRAPDGSALTELADSSSTKARVSVHNSSGGGQSIPDSTDTKLIFDVEDWDVAGNFVSSRFTAPRTGYYRVTAEVYAGAANANLTQLRIFKNGSILGADLDRRVNLQNTETIGGSATISLTSGDYIELFLKQNSGSSMVVYLNNPPVFAVEEL